MATETTKPSDKDKTSEKDAAFESKHEKELGFKRFAYIQSLYLFVPMIVGGIAALVGYHTLGKPLTRLAPKTFGFAGSAEAVAKNFRNVLDPNRLAQAMELKSQGRSSKEIMEVMGMKASDVSSLAKTTGAAVLGIPASIAGSIAVGYDKWRKDESARLAADEINHDIANLELFKPSDTEIVAENKRLRAMLAEAPQHKPHTQHPSTHAAHTGEHTTHPKEHAEHAKSHASHSGDHGTPSHQTHGTQHDGMLHDAPHKQLA